MAKGFVNIAWSGLQPATGALAPLSMRRLKPPLQAKACSTFVLMAGIAFAQMHAPISSDTGVVPADALPPALQGVGVQEHLGRSIDLNLTFEDEAGAKVNLRDFFHPGKPVVLDLVYYRCPMLCNLVLNGQTEVMRELPWTPGNEYEVVTITIDPHETRQLAAQKKAQHLATFGRPAPGWHFLTDYAGNAKRLADQVGFLYHYDARQDQYAHPAAITLLTPSGKVSRYLYGVRYKARDVRFALAEASENRTTMTIDKILLFCYHYDPQANSYTLFATNLMRGGGVVTVLLLGLYLLKAHRRMPRRAEGLI